MYAVVRNVRYDKAALLRALSAKFFEAHLLHDSLYAEVMAVRHVAFHTVSPAWFRVEDPLCGARAICGTRRHTAERPPRRAEAFERGDLRERAVHAGLDWWDADRGLLERAPLACAPPLLFFEDLRQVRDQVSLGGAALHDVVDQARLFG